MGVSFSCPFAIFSDVENGLESIIVKSVSFGDDQIKNPVRSISFKNGDSETTILKSLGSGKMTIEASVSIKSRKSEKMVSIKAHSLDKDTNMPIASDSQQSKLMDKTQSLPILDPNNPKHEAALKLQKVYKSFRTRRKLADCAVLVEQSWWKLLDFAELKRSSISFFDIEKHETAISRWSRARTRAAKVGKGLSKNDRAQKLALQHWLEAIDPRHRYGHNLHFYYLKWLHCQSKEPFFYWLDIGEGKEINLEKCPRSKLQQQCIKYLGPMERLAYEVIVEDGKFLYKQSRELLHTTAEGNGAKWIFVLSASMNLYVGKKKKGNFQHSSFLAGGATSAAGRLVIEDGILKAVWPHSGHYRPTQENFNDFISFLKKNKVDLTDVKMSPVDEEDELPSGQGSSRHLRNNSSEEELGQNLGSLETEEANGEGLIPEKIDSIGEKTTGALELPVSSRLHKLTSELPSLEIPKRKELFESLESEELDVGSSYNTLPIESPKEGYVSAAEGYTSEQDNMVPQRSSSDEQDEDTEVEVISEESSLSDEQDEETEVEVIPEESILKRINSHKGLKSYQLGKQLSCKWTTGAGPRIGCVRDYPSELQFLALEQVNLSPRSTARSRSCYFPRLVTGLTPTASPLGSVRDFSLPTRTQSSPLIRGLSAPSSSDES